MSFQKRIAFFGIILFVAKLFAWFLTKSDAIYSDAMESIVNIISAFMGLYSLVLSRKPKDHDHPYGHGKVEFITSAIEGVLIVIAGLLIISEAIKNLINGNELKDLDWGILIIAITAIINYILGGISYRKGVKENSMVLISSGKHLQSDTITTLGVVVSLVLVYFTKLNWLDSCVAIFFGGYIIFVGYKIIRKSLIGIMDEADPDIISEIVEVLNENRKDEWIDIHHMKVQQHGSHLHIDAHITLPWYYTLREAHHETENVRNILNSKYDRTIEFNFHMDDCLPKSCTVCQLSGCPHRIHPFKKSIEWNIQNITRDAKHTAE